MLLKGHTCTLLIIWYDGRKCTKLVLKLLAAKNDLPFSVLCTALSLCSYAVSFYVMIGLHSCTLTTWSSNITGLLFWTNWKQKQYSKFNILTMDHNLVLGKSSSAAGNTLPNTIIYLKAVKYLNIRLKQIFQTKLELKIRVQKIEDRMLYYDCKDSGLLCWKLKMLW